MNINLGGPYEEIARKLIKKGYGGSITEVLRQALIRFQYELEFEGRDAAGKLEDEMAAKKIEKMSAEIDSGKRKLVSLDSVLAEAGIK
jgi:Arc/MetJ-type ribon-helix-helix transcriptional regulator